MSKLNFLQIPHKLPYPPQIRGLLSTAHSNAITQFLDTYTGSYLQRKSIVKILNSISYMYVSGDSIPETWDINHPIDNCNIIEDEEVLEKCLKSIYIDSERSIEWSDADSYIQSNLSSKSKAEPVTSSSISPNPVILPSNIETVSSRDLKADLSIQHPAVPQFDTSVPWMSRVSNGVYYAIYKSLPVIPSRQCEISVTTDISLMSDSDFLKLFPDSFVQTRSSVMYTEVPGITLDPQLGLILPIEGFSESQIRDNIVRYPHLFRLIKNVDSELKPFYNTIEIDNELHKISDIWYTLPESSIIPYSKDFIKEYVVRRYLLERDINRVEHRYKMYGQLDPFLTLFAPAREYSRFGYSDPIQLAKRCVQARIDYKKSRNPIIRRFSSDD